MKKVTPIQTENLSEAIGDKINIYIEGLDRYKQAENQKILEFCQVGKFLATFFPSFQIYEAREEPDFIIASGSQKIGLEHLVIVNDEIKSEQGFYENIFHLAERDLQNDSELPNFLANCYLKRDINFQTKDKSELIEIVKNCVKSSILTKSLPENPLVERIFQMPHSQKNLTVNFGAHMVKNLDNSILSKYIEKKEKKVNNYILNTQIPQWLLLIAGGVSEYSYEISENIKLKATDSQFEKIFILADFDNILYELK